MCVVLTGGKNEKKIIILIILILISILTLIGSSYALLTKKFTSKKLSVEVGTLKVDFTEGNAITMDNVVPMTDENGMNTTPYTFTITNSGTIDSYYTIYNEEDSNNTLDTTYLKYKLVSNDGYDSGIKRLKDIGTGTYRIVDETSLATGKSVTYKLYLWISSDADNSVQDKVYKSKIVVSSTSNKTNDTVAGKLLKGVGNNGFIDTTDSEQTFIVGTNPNNYIWYSGKLWRAVSIDPSDNSVKLVTQWNISAFPYNASGNTAFQGSYMEQWLNDTSVDGFLGNLREPDKFIKTDSVWNATSTTETTKPAKTTMVTDAVGLLNVYEYTMSYKNATDSTGYLNNGLHWWLLTPYSTSRVCYVSCYGNVDRFDSVCSYGSRPSINLKSAVKIIDGDGTVNNPYRLQGDNDNPTGALLSTRYSGEYISFGTGENNLYRIVSHENGTGTKITSAIPLKDSDNYKELAFGDNVTFSKDNTIGTFLNGDYLTSGTYLSNDQVNMIEDNTTWYLGTVSGTNYKLAKYQDITGSNLTTSTTTAKIGLLRLGELMTEQFSKADNNTSYWTLTPYSTTDVRYVSNLGHSAGSAPGNSNGSRPSMNLKSTVKIVSGTGTKSDPFILSGN